VKGNIVISSHHDLRLWKRTQESPCLVELPHTRTLREIPRNRDDIRMDLVNLGDQRRQNRLIHPAKVDIRKMN
jgi:hypothetical protein